MQRSLWLLAALVVWVFAFAYQIGTLYPQMPERVATHFNFYGQADAWSQKSSLITLYGVVIAPLVVMFPVLWAVMPFLPARTINLPHKEYWLAPERRGETIEAVRTFLLWIGHATAALLFALMEMTLRANLRADPHLGGAFGWMLGGYMVLIFVLSGWLWLRFRR